MSLAIEKSEIIKKHQTHGTDTGTPEVQVALMTERVRYLTDHLKQHPKDHHTRLGLLKLVGRRRRLLDYLARRDISRYRSLVETLGLRR
ncbi:MAG: small subunit ribosomal protein [Chloroflexota bacterium]|jgi:small subunit ribosomal protein S15|nr:small subunit ribosomal protein [Chloroflexota bacterium]